MQWSPHSRSVHSKRRLQESWWPIHLFINIYPIIIVQFKLFSLHYQMTITKREPNKRTDKGCILFPGGLGLRMENEYGRQLSWVMK